MRLTKAIHAVAVGAVVTAVLASPSDARADEVKPTAKGVTGCALLGGEVVVFAEGIFGVRSPAAYLIGAGAGVVAGGVGGYFLEQGVSDGRIRRTRSRAGSLSSSRRWSSRSIRRVTSRPKARARIAP